MSIINSTLLWTRTSLMTKKIMSIINHTSPSTKCLEIQVLITNTI